jgi:hypothetical protein
MDKLEFAEEMSKLALSKQQEISRELLEVYWEDLKECKMLKKTLEEARKKKYFKGMPTVSELLTDHMRMYDHYQRIQRTMDMLRLEESREDSSCGLDKFLFCNDAMNIFGFNCNFIWDLMDTHNIQTPENYRDIHRKYSEIERNNLIKSIIGKYVEKEK